MKTYVTLSPYPFTASAQAVHTLRNISVCCSVASVGDIVMSISIQKQRLVSLALVLLTGLFAGIVRGQTPESPVNKGTPATETKTDEVSKTKTPAPVEEKITVTATRFERLIDLTPQSVTVMNAMEIHSRPMWNVQATLDDAPGISLQRVGGLDGQIVVRGLSSLDSRIVLFIDGDRFRGRNFLEYSLLDPTRSSVSRLSAAQPLRSMDPMP